MFGCLRSRLVLHYGSDPLGGFHLAPVHAKLAPYSPLDFEGKSLPTSMGQFSAWSK
jgi:hypothetical protein